MSLLAPELIGLLEFVAEQRRAQIFAQEGEALLKGEQCALDGFGISVGDVAPHGIGAGTEARHLAQRAAAHVFELGCVADFFFKQSAERSGRELRQVADPGDEFVVADGIEIESFGAHGGNEGAPIFGKLCAARRKLRR